MKVLGKEIGVAVDKLHVIGSMANARPRPTRADVERAEREIKRLVKSGVAQKVSIITTHYFANGIHAREAFMPAGTIATGEEHKKEHINVLAKGELVVMTDEGMRHLKAPMTFVSRAGTKRIGRCITDVVWLTFHPNPYNETNFFKLEDAAVKKRKGQKPCRQLQQV